MEQSLQLLSVQFVPFVMAVVFHEFAHGFMAWFWGDKTAQESGRMTLNPVPHVDVFGTLVFPIVSMLAGSVVFGWARPVPIDPRRFRKFRPGLFWVSAAGPLMNFFLAVLAAASYCAIRLWVPETFYLSEPLQYMAFAAVSMNYALGIFNLLPLPPLDGSKIIESMLPLKWIAKYESLTRYSFFILMGLLVTGALQVLGVPIRYLSQLTLLGMAILFRLPEIQ